VPAADIRWPQDWSQPWTEDLDEPSIAEFAGAKVFARGVDIFRSGAVDVIDASEALPEPFIRAQVQGTSMYITELVLRDQGLHSDCTCPHGEDGNFCKHQVALALTWLARLAGLEVDADPVAQKKAQTVAKRSATMAAKAQSLRDFVHAQSTQALAERLLHWADHSPELRRDLRAWQAMTEAGGNLADTKKAFTALLAYRGFLDWRACAAYARQAAQVLPLLHETLRSHPEAALSLAEHAYERLHSVMHHADDSGGHIGALASEVLAQWLAALKAAGPRPAAFADRYLKLHDMDLFGGIDHAAVIHAMGPASTKRYGEVVRTRWEQAAEAEEHQRARSRERPRGRERYVSSRSDSGLFSARWRYLEHLRALRDTEEILHVLRATLYEPADHVLLVNELEAQQRQREALEAAQAAYRDFPDIPQVVEQLLRCYDRDGWDAEALAVRRAWFNRFPSAQGFLDLLRCARAAKVDVDALRAELWGGLETLEQAELARCEKMPGPRPDGPNVSLRLEILLLEKRVDDALVLAQRPHRANHRLLERLALALPARQNGAAVELLQRVFDWRMARAQSPYSDVLDVVAKTLARMPRERGRAWVAQLRGQFKAKRNFIKGLPDA
jgi:tryptophan 2,3-dioxygenase